MSMSTSANVCVCACVFRINYDKMCNFNIKIETWNVQCVCVFQPRRYNINNKTDKNTKHTHTQCQAILTIAHKSIIAVIESFELSSLQPPPSQPLSSSSSSSFFAFHCQCCFFFLFVLTIETSTISIEISMIIENFF